MIRVRFAPSPTGYLHMGGVRTALFNFLYARSQRGRFLLRIEDTDRERSRKEYEDEILEALEWLGLTWDDAIVRQSERRGVYQKTAKMLVERGLAYEEREFDRIAVKFKMPAKQAVFHDLVHAAVEFDTSLFEDLVILKSDGYPTYHWACVVDDHEMEITHVIRGDDHLSNTPRQLLLYEAMGWTPPKFAHLPLILGEDGTPLSKRHGAVALRSFKENGSLAEGLLNYLALLGWGPPNNQEFFSLKDLVEKFSLKRINKAGAQFSLEKMEWLNAQHIKNLPEEEYLARITAFHADLSRGFPEAVWKRLCLLYKSRVKTWKDLTAQASYCFSEELSYGPSQRNSFFSEPHLGEYLKAWAETAGGLRDFEDVQALEKVTREAAQKFGVEAKILIHPLRFALTGTTVSPGLFELMSVLGKETCLKRVRGFLSPHPNPLPSARKLADPSSGG